MTRIARTGTDRRPESVPAALGRRLAVTVLLLGLGLAGLAGWATWQAGLVATELERAEYSRLADEVRGRVERRARLDEARLGHAAFSDDLYATVLRLAARGDDSAWRPSFVDGFARRDGDQFIGLYDLRGAPLFRWAAGAAREMEAAVVSTAVFRMLDNGEPAAGLVRRGSELFWMAGAPVLPAAGGGQPIRGYLVTARALHPAALATGPGERPVSLALEAMEPPRQPVRASVRAAAGDSVQVTFAIPDVFARQNTRAVITASRGAYAVAETRFRNLFLASLAAIALLLAAVWWLGRRWLADAARRLSAPARGAPERAGRTPAAPPASPRSAPEPDKAGAVPPAAHLLTPVDAVTAAPKAVDAGPPSPDEPVPAAGSGPDAAPAWDDDPAALASGTGDVPARASRASLSFDSPADAGPVPEILANATVTVHLDDFAVPPEPVAAAFLARLPESSTAGTLARQTAALFVQDAPIRLRDLAVAIGQGDRSLASGLAQAVRGLADLVGANPVASACAALGNAAREGTLADLHAALSRLEDALAAALAALAPWVSGPALGPDPTHRPPIDPAALARLRDALRGDDPGFGGQLVSLFLAEAPVRVAALERAAGAGDSAAMRAAAADLRGMCSLVGADPLGELAEALQHVAPGDHATRLAALHAALGRTTQVLEDLLHHRVNA